MAHAYAPGGDEGIGGDEQQDDLRELQPGMDALPPDPAQWTAEQVQLFLHWFKAYTSLNALDPAAQFQDINGQTLMAMNCQDFLNRCSDGDIIYEFLHKDPNE